MVPTGLVVVTVIVTVLVVKAEVKVASVPLAGFSLKLMTHFGAEALALQKLV